MKEALLALYHSILLLPDHRIGNGSGVAVRYLSGGGWRAEGLEQARHAEHVGSLGAGVEDVAVLPAEIAELLHLGGGDPLLMEHLGHGGQQGVF